MFAASSHSSAQLMQLCQAQPLSIFHHHQGGVGNIHTHFDHRSGDQQLRVAPGKAGHPFGFFFCFHAAVDQLYAQVRQGDLQFREGGFRRLGLQLFGFLDERADPVRLGIPFLGVRAAGIVDPFDHLGAAAFRQHQGIDGLAPRRHFVDHRGVQVAIHAHGQGAGNGSGGEC